VPQNHYKYTIEQLAFPVKCTDIGVESDSSASYRPELVGVVWAFGNYCTTVTIVTAITNMYSEEYGMQYFVFQIYGNA
jgi:ABC-type polysaccharide/polyol phosphate export permease